MAEPEVPERSLALRVPVAAAKALRAWTTQTRAAFAASGSSRDLAAVDVPDPVAGDGVEGVSVHLAAKLVAVLAYPHLSMRSMAATRLRGLAAVLSGEHPGAGAVPRDARGVRALMRELGPALQPVVAGVVASLEAYYLHRSEAVRAVALAAATELVVANEALFAREDQLAALWHVYMSLDAPSGARRAAQCGAVRSLAGVLVRADEDLALRMLRRLLCLPRKLRSDRAEVQAAATALLDALAAREEPVPAARLLDVLTGMLSAQRVDNYDLLCWALREGLQRLEASEADVDAFVSTLARHWRAQQRLLRLGAALAMHALVGARGRALLERAPLIVRLAVTGCLDDDYRVASACAALLELAADLLARADWALALAERRRGAAAPLERRPTLVEALRAVLASDGAPAASTDEVHQLIVSLQFLPAAARQRRLQLVLLWAPRLGEVPSVLLHSLVAVLEDQYASIEEGDDVRGARHTLVQLYRVLACMAAPLAGVAPDDMATLGSHFEAVLEGESDSELISASLDTLGALPLTQLPEARLDALLARLLRKALQPGQAWRVRLSIYDVIGRSARLWRTRPLQAKAVAVLCACLGDVKAECVSYISDSLQRLLGDGGMGGSLVAQLPSLARGLARSAVYERVDAYDAVATVLEANSHEHGDLADVAEVLRADDAVVSVLADLFAPLLHTRHGAAAAQRAATEAQARARAAEARGGGGGGGGGGERSDQQMPPHHAVWVAMLYAKLDRPLGAAAGAEYEFTPQTAAPEETAGEPSANLLQLFYTLLPSADVRQRRAAAQAVWRCCFRSGKVAFDVAQVYFDARSRHGRESAMRVLQHLTPVHVRGLNAWVVRRLMEPLLDVVSTEKSPTLRQAALELLEALLLAMPRSCARVLENVRDHLRELLSAQQHSGLLLKLTVRLYPLVFWVAAAADDAATAREYLAYAKGDLAPVLDGAGDPLLAGLSRAQVRWIVLASVDALGALQHAAVCGEAVQTLLPLTRSPDAEVREHAVAALLAQAELLDRGEAVPVRWAALPLAGDPAERVRRALARVVVNNSGSLLALRAAAMPSAPDDHPRKHKAKKGAGFEMPEPEFEQELPRALQRRGSGAASAKAVLAYQAAPAGWSRVPAEWSAPPSLDMRFARRLGPLIDGFCGEPLPKKIPEIEYNLQELGRVPGLEAAAVFVLSELIKIMADLSPDSALTAMRTLRFTHEEAQQVPHSVVLASAVALENVATHNVELVVPFVVESLLGSETVAKSDLLALKHSTRPLEGHPAKYCQLVSSDMATGICTKCLQAIDAPDLTLDLKMAALDLLGDAATAASPEVLPDVVRSIVTTLEGTQDRDLHHSCHAQLLKIFKTLSFDHPLVATVVTEFHASVRSIKPTLRHTAVTLFGILGATMTAADVLQHCVRLLADPDPQIRDKILAILVAAGGAGQPDSHLARVARCLTAPAFLAREAPEDDEDDVAEEAPAAKTAADESQQVGQNDEDPLESDDDEQLMAVGRVPLANADPLNKKFLRGDAYRRLMGLYGIPLDAEAARRRAAADAAAAEAAAAAASEGAVVAETAAPEPTPLQLEPLEDGGSVEAKVRRLMRLDPAVLIRELLREDRGKGEELLRALQGELVAATGTVTTGDAQQVQHELSAIGFTMELFMTIVRAAEGVRDDTHEFLEAIHSFVRACSMRCDSVRAAVAETMTQMAFVQDSPAQLPITSDAEWERAQEHKRVVDLIARDAKARHTLRMERLARQEELAELHAVLWNVSQLMLRMLDLLARLYAVLQAVQPQYLIRSFDWLLGVAQGDAHRGVRRTVRDVVVALAKRNAAQDEFYAHAVGALHAIKDRLDPRLGGTAEEQRAAAERRRKLYRRRADLLYLLAHLLWVARDEQLRLDGIDLLIYHWDDPDGACRAVAVDMIQMLCEQRMPEVLQLMAPQRDQSSTLMTAITTRIKSPTYPDKDALNKLLSWYFANAAVYS